VVYNPQRGRYRPRCGKFDTSGPAEDFRDKDLKKRLSGQTGKVSEAAIFRACIAKYSIRTIDKTPYSWYNALDGKLREWRLRIMFKIPLHKQRGQGLTEYALVLSIVSIAAVATVTIFGHIIIDTFYGMINNAMSGL
jgi:Flp pilus assembly pilin Flp